MVLSTALVSLPLGLSPKSLLNLNNAPVIYSPFDSRRRRRAVLKDKDSNSDIKREAPPSKSVRFIKNLLEISLIAEAPGAQLDKELKRSLIKAALSSHKAQEQEERQASLELKTV